jgi:hypothetical protein
MITRSPKRNKGGGPRRAASRDRDKGDDTQAELDRYRTAFEQIGTFTDAIRFHEDEIKEQMAIVNEAKAAYDTARATLRELEDARDGAKHSLYRFLCPNNGEFMPLFDRMDEADEEVHGKHAADWRSEPVANLKLSVASMQILADADIVVIGQLQDRVLADSRTWFQEFEGLSESAAAAIVDKLNDFIYERTQR